MSVNYCVGNIGIKRRFFNEKKEGAIVADCDDSLGWFSLSGELYCIVAPPPFANMSVKSFIRYKRALLGAGRAMSDAEIKYVLGQVGLKVRLSRKVGSLSAVLFRHLTLAAKWNPTVGSVYVNLDALSGGALNRRRVKALCSALEEKFEVYVAVSDSRLIPKNARILDFSAEKTEQIKKPRPQKSVAVSKKFLQELLKRRPYFSKFVKDAKKPVRIFDGKTFKRSARTSPPAR